MQWLYRLIRKRTKPIPRAKARLYHERLSVWYYMLAWTAGGYAFMQMLTSDPKEILPDELNVHADSKNKVQSSVYRVAQTINKPDTDMEMQVFTFKNFSFHNLEKLNVQDLQDKVDHVKSREEKDFFGEGDIREELIGEEEQIVIN